MRDKTSTRLGLMLALAAAVAFAGIVQAQQATDPNPRPGQPGHYNHEEWQGDYPSATAGGDFDVVRTLPLPEGFLGNVAADPETGRIWLVSFGPPTAPGPSTVYEIDPRNGDVLRRAELPLKGDLSSPVYLDGHLYQGVFHESKMHKIVVDDAERFGEIVATVDLPKLADLNLVDEAHPMPFIEFGGVGVTPDGNLVIHADDVGEFITLDPDDGSIVARTRTLKALGGIFAAHRGEGDYLIVGNSDPRGGYCALSYPPALSRTPEQRDISWAVMDGASGEVLASVRRQNSRAYASGVSLLRYEQANGAPYGKFAFLATGEEGLLEIEWTPARDAY